MRTKKVIIVMPAYNAEKTIQSVFERIPKDVLGRISDFIVVNDGSTDGTENTVRKLAKKYPIKLINHEENKGYGGAQKTGFRQALKDNADIVVLLHSDGQYAPELLMEMIKPIEDGKADIVGGSRILGKEAIQGGMPWLRYVGNIALTKMENLVLGWDITTYHSGYKSYSGEVLEKINFEKLVDKFSFDSEMLFMAKKYDFNVVEIPIPTRYGEEVSYLNPVTYGLGILRVILKFLLGKY